MTGRSHGHRSSSSSSQSAAHKLKKILFNQAHERKQLSGLELRMILDTACHEFEDVDLKKVFGKAEIQDDTIVNWDHFLQNYAHLLKKYKSPPLFSLLAASLGKAKRMFKVGDRVQAKPIRWDEDHWETGEIKRCQAQDALVEFDNYQYSELWIPTLGDRLRHDETSKGTGTFDGVRLLATSKNLSQAVGEVSQEAQLLGCLGMLLFLYYMGSVIMPSGPSVKHSGGGDSPPTRSGGFGLVIGALMLLALFFIYTKYVQSRSADDTATFFQALRSADQLFSSGGQPQEATKEVEFELNPEFNPHVSLQPGAQSDVDEKSTSSRGRHSRSPSPTKRRPLKRERSDGSRSDKPSPFRALQNHFKNQSGSRKSCNYNQLVNLLQNLRISGNDIRIEDLFDQLQQDNQVSVRDFWKSFHKNVGTTEKNAGRDHDEILRAAIIKEWQSPTRRILSKLESQSRNKTNVKVKTIERIVKDAGGLSGQYGENMQTFGDYDKEVTVNWKEFMKSLKRKTDAEPDGDIDVILRDAIQDCVKDRRKTSKRKSSRSKSAKSKQKRSKRKKDDEDITSLWKFRVSNWKYGDGRAASKQSRGKAGKQRSRWKGME